MVLHSQLSMYLVLKPFQILSFPRTHPASSQFCVLVYIFPSARNSPSPIPLLANPTHHCLAQTLLLTPTQSRGDSHFSLYPCIPQSDTFITDNFTLFVNIFLSQKMSSIRGFLDVVCCEKPHMLFPLNLVSPVLLCFPSPGIIYSFFILVTFCILIQVFEAH